MKNNAKIPVSDPGQKGFDSVSGKKHDPTATQVLGADGGVLSDMGQQRKDAIDELYTKMQETLMGTLSGTGFSGKLDALTTYLFEIKAYAESLRSAADRIVADYPLSEVHDENEEESVTEMDTADSLREISDLCDVLEEGIQRVESYINAVRTFSGDLSKIQQALYDKSVALFQEL